MNATEATARPQEARPDDLACEPGDGNGARVPPDYSIVRKMAEAASGVRDRGEVWLVYDPTPPPDLKEYANKVRASRVPPGSSASPKAVVLHVVSAPVNPAPSPPTMARIGKGDLEINLLNLDEKKPTVEPIAADSVFWTESAVEKFVIPYYASVHGHEAPERVAKILKVLHGKGPRDAGDPINFALIHLPTSEYVQEQLVPEGMTPQADEFYIARLDPARGTAGVVSLEAWAAAEPGSREA